MDQDLKGKTFVVTGANSGIGRVAAGNFANRGATVILVCRSKERGMEALDTIRAESANDDVELMLADFASLTSVSAVADQLLQKFNSIDVLCNNAGGANGSFTRTEEGFETTFVTNHLSAFLLTYKLLPALLEAGKSDLCRVVFTSSYGHTNSALDFSDLNLDKGYTTLKAYGRSKLMNLLTARELQRRFGDQGIVASSFHPGAVRTPIWAKGGAVGKVVGALLYPFMISETKGTETFIWLATSNDDAARHTNGDYFYKCKRKLPAAHATDEDALKLWETSEELIIPFLQPNG